MNIESTGLSINRPSINRRNLSFDTRSFLKIINKQLEQIALDLATPESSLNLDGVIIDAENKFDAGISFLLQLTLEELKQKSKTIAKVREDMLNIEKENQRMLSGL
jgi:hypothetical protein